MNSRFLQCPSCSRMLIDHYAAFKKMGIIWYGPQIGTTELLIKNVSSLDGGNDNTEIGRRIKTVRAYIAKHKLTQCCIARLMGASNIDSSLSRIVIFGNDGELKTPRI